MNDKPIYVTPKGLEELRAELVYLQQVKLPEIVTQMTEVTEGGEWDNTEAQLVGDALAFVETRIQELEYMVQHAQLIEIKPALEVVRVGSTAVLEISNNDLTTEQYTIVGAAEANPSQGFISNESPMGQAILNRRVGDRVEVKVPDGVLRIRIVAVK